MAIRKYSVYVYIPAYGGNGGLSSMHPDVAVWLARLMVQLREDKRIECVILDTESDTPVTMCRNNAVLKARKANCDLLLSCDSDQSPLKHQHDPWYKPFWDEAFRTIDEHYDKGPLVVGAPYCGPPNGEELCYVFYFDNLGDHGEDSRFKLCMYPRTIAATMTGVQPCAALPTGMILCDMRIFDVLEPSQRDRKTVLTELAQKKLTVEQAERELTEGWFYYEWRNGYAAEKISTEDVAFSRDVSIIGSIKLGYNPLRCAWDSWVGHHKPWNVGKPSPYSVEQVGTAVKRALDSEYTLAEKRDFFQASPKVLNLFEVK